MRAVAMRVAIAMTLLGSLAQAADQALPGTKLLVLDPTGVPSTRGSGPAPEVKPCRDTTCDGTGQGSQCVVWECQNGYCWATWVC